MALKPSGQIVTSTNLQITAPLAMIQLKILVQEQTNITVLHGMLQNNIKDQFRPEYDGLNSIIEIAN